MKKAISLIIILAMAYYLVNVIQKHWNWIPVINKITESQKNTTTAEVAEQKMISFMEEIEGI